MTERGLRHNVDVGIQYLDAWLQGAGCVPIYHLMEDAATAEISRSQLWQWVRHRAILDDGRPITLDLVRATIAEELAKLRDRASPDRSGVSTLELAAKLFEEMTASPEFPEWLTTVAYPHLG